LFGLHLQNAFDTQGRFSPLRVLMIGSPKDDEHDYMRIGLLGLASPGVMISPLYAYSVSGGVWARLEWNKEMKQALTRVKGHSGHEGATVQHETFIPHRLDDEYDRMILNPPKLPIRTGMTM
jgi:hypothetical protein